jgi:hypothetical protein
MGQLRRSFGMTPIKLRMGAWHAQAATFAFVDDIVDSGGNARMGANGGACGYADRYRYARFRVHPGFLGHVGSSLHPQL